MKKIFLILMPVILTSFLAVLASLPQTKLQKPEGEISTSKNQKNKTPENLKGHEKQSLNCKSCHLCEYPTKQDPCLIECPRKEIASINRSPKEGPDVVVINEMSDNYMGVVFSHRIHSQMSELSDGCTGCHHYNTTGPILNCRNCHENNRSRENVSVPDLKAAYHRKCLSCHKQWSHENGCSNQCHLRKGEDIQYRRQQAIKGLIGKTHPELPEPTKMLWETNYDAGKIVTFFHNEHIQLFKINCTSCHSQENCVKCHENKIVKDYNKPVKIQKSFEEHHKPCDNCHYGNSCNKRHRETEMTNFNHGKSTGWQLSTYHSSLACSKCHGSSMPYKRLDKNCVSCHKNFTQGKFDHKLVGLIFSDNHKDLECKNCHLNGDFTRSPKCSECHDDKSYPAQLPGKKN